MMILRQRETFTFRFAAEDDDALASYLHQAPVTPIRNRL
jgi:hypothetical protein